VFRLLFAFVPIYWIVQRIDLRATLHQAMAVGWPMLGASLGVSLVGILAGSVRWRVLMRAYGAKRTPGQLTLVRHYLVAVYYSVLPTGLAGEVLRGYRVRAFLDLPRSYTVVVVERLVGLIGLLLIAGAAVLFSPPLEANVIIRALDVGIGAAVCCVIGFVALPYATSRAEAWRSSVARVPLIGGLLLKVPPARSAAGVLAAVGLSLFTQGAAVLSTYLIAHRLSPDTTLLQIARVVPYTILLSWIPITPLAVGQRDFLAIYFLGRIGISAEKALAVSLVQFSLGIIVIALGGICHLLERLLGIVSEEESGLQRAGTARDEQR
jgi:glycosyltransferase 2 family protein